MKELRAKQQQHSAAAAHCALFSCDCGIGHSPSHPSAAHSGSVHSTYLYLNYTGAQYYGLSGGSINDTNSDFNTSSYLLTSIQYTYTGTLNFYKNNSVKLTAASRTITGQAYDRILGQPFGPRSNYYMSEMILYSNNQSSNLSAINTNINAYYGIY